MNSTLEKYVALKGLILFEYNQCHHDYCALRIHLSIDVNFQTTAEPI